MLCKDIMKTTVECVSPETPIRDAARRMRDQKIGFLPVCSSMPIWSSRASCRCNGIAFMRRGF